MAKRKNTFIHKPVYPGGKTALQAFLREHLTYPDAAKENGTEGSVRVEYSLNQQGKVIKATAVSGPKDGCREEAERLVKMLRFRVPKDYKMSVRYHQHLNINFKAPTKTKKARPPATGRITYTITPSPSKGTEQNGTDSGTSSNDYGYTINW